MLKLRPGITDPATLEYRLEDEMISEYVAKRQAEGDTRPMLEIATEYNDGSIPLTTGAEMIFATVLGWKIKFAGEEF